MKKLNFFDYWLIGELIFCLVLLLILPQQIKLNFWIILTSKETSGSVLNIFVLPLIMALPNIIQRSESNYPDFQYYPSFIDHFLVADTAFWTIKKLLMKSRVSLYSESL